MGKHKESILNSKEMVQSEFNPSAKKLEYLQKDSNSYCKRYFFRSFSYALFGSGSIVAAEFISVHLK